MHNSASVLENDTHNLLWDFDIQTDHLILDRRPDLIIINEKKRICKIVGFAVPADCRVKLKEREKNDEYLDLARELKEVTFIPIVISTLGRFTKGLVNGLEDLMTSADYPNYCIINIDQNTEKNPRDLRWLAVTHTPVNDHQLKLMWKTLKE